MSTTPRDADAPVEVLGRGDGVLAGEPVHDQQRLARGGRVADPLDLGHQGVVDGEPAGGVEHDHVVAAERGLLFGAFGDGDGVLARHDGQGVDADLEAEDGELFHRGRALRVERGHQHALAVAVLEAFGELGGRRRLARALEAHDEDRGRRVVDAQSGRALVAGEDADQLVMDDLDDLLAGGDRFGDGLAFGLLGDGLDEVAGDGEGDVGLQQGHADFAQRGRDVVVAERALFGELAEDAGKPVGQVLEHGPRLSSTRIAPVGATR